MIPVTSRILLRYLAMCLVTRGLLGADDAAAITADPDISMMIEVGIGTAIAGLTEGWHLLARKFGWEH